MPPMAIFGSVISDTCIMFLNFRIFNGKSMTMGLGDIREELHQFINTADERVLNLLYEILKVDTTDPSLTSEEQKEIDKRLAKHLAGESKSHSWSEARRQIERK
jgi:hypothetical protein